MIKKIGFLITIFILIFTGCAYMYNQENIMSNEGHNDRYLVLALAALLVYYFTAIRRLYNTTKLPYIYISFRNFTLWMIAVITIYNIFWGAISLVDYLVHISKPLYFCLLFKVAYCYTSAESLNKRIKWLFALSLIPFAYTYILIYNFSSFFNLFHLASSYYLLCLLPLLLLCDSKYVKLCSFIVVAVIVFSSLKRGGTIALMLATIVYLFVYNYVKTRKLAKGTIITLLSMPVVVYMFYRFGTYGEETIIERLNSLQNDEGSGRESIYRNVFSLIKNQELITLVFGNGENAVMRHSASGYSAHNDYLEILYNYGIIGFVFYIQFTIRFVGLFFSSLKQNNNLAPVLALSIIIFLVLSNISHIVIYMNMTLLIMFIGICCGQLEYEKRYINL